MFNQYTLLINNPVNWLHICISEATCQDLPLITCYREVQCLKLMQPRLADEVWAQFKWCIRTLFGHDGDKSIDGVWCGIQNIAYFLVNANGWSTVITNAGNLLISIWIFIKKLIGIGLLDMLLVYYFIADMEYLTGTFNENLMCVSI